MVSSEMNGHHLSQGIDIKTIIAVAHSMLIIAYTMLKTNRPYQELGGTYLEQINKDQLQRYYVKRLQRLGLTVTVQPAA
jgi:transposase